MRRLSKGAELALSVALSLALPACTNHATATAPRCGAELLLAFTRAAYPDRFQGEFRGNDVWTVRVDRDGLPRGSPKQVTKTHLAESPAVSPDGRRIVWANRTGISEEAPSELWQMEADGSRPRRLLASDRDSFEAVAFAPDGDHLAVVVFVGAAAQAFSGTAIAVVDGDGQHLRRLASLPGTASGLSWSPDGRRIAFTTSANVGDRTQRNELRELVVASKRQRLLWSSPPSAQPAPLLTGGIYSPDGRKLLVQEGPGPVPGRLRLFDPVSRRLGPPVSEGTSRSPALLWARDGRTVLVVDGRFTVVRIDLATGAHRDVVAGATGTNQAGRSFDLQPCRV